MMAKRQLQAVGLGLALSAPLIAAAVVAQERMLVCVETREGERVWLKCRPPMTMPTPTPPPTPAPSPSAPSPEPTPRPEPTPIPTSSPTPSPGPTTSPSPPGGQVGGGWQTQGGAGCPKGNCGKRYEVTNLGDRGPGTLRAGVEGRSGANGGPVSITFAVAGTIKLMSQLQIRAPYVTIDGLSAPPPGITLLQGKCDERMVGILSTHDVLIVGLRFDDSLCWEPGKVEHNWETLLADGDTFPDVIPWDDEPLLEWNRDIYIASSTMVNAMNDAGSSWCGMRGFTFANNLVVYSYHPVVSGCKGWRAFADKESRHHVSIYQNVFWKNGERGPKICEGCYDCDVVNNVTGSWQNYSGLDPEGSGPGGYGMQVKDPPNRGLNWMANVLLLGLDHYVKRAGQIVLEPGPWRPAWDCVWGDDPGSPVGDPRMEKQHYSGNWFTPQHNPLHCKSTPGGEVAFKRDYPLPVLPASQLGAVIDQAGMPWPTQRELDWKAEVLAAYRARVGQ